MTTASAAMTLFLIMDPLGNLPLFLAALASVAPARRLWVVTRELLIAYGVLVLFLFSGQFLLRLLGISQPALTIAGGVVLFLIALRMVFPSPDRPLSEGLEGEPFIVPLAIPYVVGPSSMTMVMLLRSQEPQRWAEWWMAVTLAWLGCAVLLLLGSSLSRYLGHRGLIAIERLMGMVLVAVAIQIFLSGIKLVMAEGGLP